MFSLLSLNRNISVCSLRRSLVCQNSPFGKSWTSCPPFHQGSNSSNTTTNSSTEALLQSSRSSTFSSLDLTRRFKHSSTQIKRLFRKHPARLRIEGRQGIDRTNPAVVPLQPLLFPPIFTPVFLSNGWSAPPTSVSLQQQSEFSALETTTTTTTVNTSHNEGILPNYPFRVQRTRNKPNDAIGFLPVYTKHRKDGTKVVTRIKKVDGDQALFLQELRTVLSLPEPANGIAAYDSIRIRTGGTIEINGHVAREVRTWLAGLGF